MNCSLVQRRLSSLSHADRPSASVKAHLHQCAACREWQRHILLLDQQVAQLPVPPTLAETAFLHRLRTEKRISETIRSYLPRHREWWVRFAGVAAAILVFVLIWKLVPGRKEQAPPVAQ